MFSKHNKKLFVKLSAATLLALIPQGAKAQSLNCFDPLLFGSITPCGAAGTVTISPSNSQSTSCVAATAPYSRARCIVTQLFPFRPIQIQITSPSFLISSGGNNMNVNAFNIISDAGGPSTTITAPFVNIPIGATLNVGSTQASGTYTGTFTISVVLQ